MMPEHKKKKKTLKRVLKWLVTLVVLGVVGLVVWMYLVPMVTANSVTVYDSYVVQTGDISTTKSFSATLSVKKSETFSSEEECSVREIYVASGDAVAKGDSLILLSTGELFTASFDGVVNEIRVKVGDFLWPNFSVVQISDLEHLEVSMDVDEYDVEKLSLGQSCTVSVISLGIDFDTVLAHINRVSQSQGNVAFYSVTCDLTVPENVLPGMQATVTLPSESVTGVITLDMDALTFDEDDTPYVLIKDAAGTYQKQTVETGLSDGMKVEITSGLTSGQTVYKVSGTESVQSGITLESLYKMIFGETEVVNDLSSHGGPSGMGQTGEAPQMGPNGTAGVATDGTQTEATVPTGDITQDVTTESAVTDVTATEATTAQTDASADEQTGDTTTDTTAATMPSTDGQTPPSGVPGDGQPPQGIPQSTDSTDTAVTDTSTTTTDATTTTTQEGGSVNVD